MRVFQISLLLLAVLPAGVCGTRSLALGDARRGGKLVRSLNCLICHSIRGEGGKEAPELDNRVDRRGYSPSGLASRLWNHGPAMWAAFERRGLRRPELNEQQAADLFAYFFTTGYLDEPGNASRGRELFQAKRCRECHGINSPVHPAAKPLAAWPSLDDPVALAEDMWNHSREMSSALGDKKIPKPSLTSQEISDILAYSRTLPGRRASPGRSTSASSAAGQMLYRAKGCARCHTGALALEQRPTRYSPIEFAAAMWNHPWRTPSIIEPLSYDEMSGLIGYLFSRQFFEERGDIERGRRVYAQKKCGACHDQALYGAPPLSGMAGRMTSYGMVAALWRHGPTMESRMQQIKNPWPRFSSQEMADLTAYLHGIEFKRRLGAAPPGP